jgi:hypothetical protein
MISRRWRRGLLVVTALAFGLGVRSDISEPPFRLAPAADRATTAPTPVATPAAPSDLAGSASVGRPAEAEVVLLPRRL